MKEEIIALYIRLSLEDSKYDSMSIENQQMILREKVLSLSGIDHAEIREFVDNGPQEQILSGLPCRNC